MSRIGKLPVKLPKGVKAIVDGNTITIEGPKGKIVKSFNEAISIHLRENEVIVERNDETRFSKAMTGTARSIINGMAEGVVKGYSKTLELSGVPLKAVLKGKVLELNLGFSSLVEFNIPNEVGIKVPEPTKVIIEGKDKQLVGQTAALIRQKKRAEPYKGKGIKYSDEVINRKEGKKSSKG